MEKIEHVLTGILVIRPGTAQDSFHIHEGGKSVLLMDTTTLTGQPIAYRLAKCTVTIEYEPANEIHMEAQI